MKGTEHGGEKFGEKQRERWRLKKVALSQQTIESVYTESRLVLWRKKMKPSKVEGPWEVDSARARESQRVANSVLGGVESERCIIRNVLFSCVL